MQGKLLAMLCGAIVAHYMTNALLGTSLYLEYWFTQEAGVNQNQ